MLPNLAEIPDDRLSVPLGFGRSPLVDQPEKGREIRGHGSQLVSRRHKRANRIGQASGKGLAVDHRCEVGAVGDPGGTRTLNQPARLAQRQGQRDLDRLTVVRAGRRGLEWIPRQRLDDGSSSKRSQRLTPGSRLRLDCGPQAAQVNGHPIA